MTDSTFKTDMDEPELVMPQETDLHAAAQGQGAAQSAFLVTGTESRLWFRRRSDVLFITFDNLATVDEGDDRGPWMWRRVRDLGYSVLGVQSYRKDWYRHQTTAPMLRHLSEQGFFRQFSTIVMMGASMGGFAALNFAPLIPGARVLVFSPQTSMNKKIVPYEHRFRYSVRRSDWGEMPFLDAAAAVPYISAITVLYDPFVPEDKAHAARMTAPHVQFLRLRHTTHEAIRVIIYCDAMHLIMENMVVYGYVRSKIWEKMRHRRWVRKWSRRFVDHINDGRHSKLTYQACNFLVNMKPDLQFARLARDAAKREIAEKAASDSYKAYDL